MRTSFSVFLTVILALGLVGCRSFWDPTFVPAGYHYYDGQYNAPDGPEAEDIGYHYSEAANAEVLQVWRIVVEDLVDQLGEQVGDSQQGIYVEHLPQTNAFNNSYDHMLRETLGNRGYVLTTNPEGALHLWYEAFVPKYIEETRPVEYAHNDQNNEPLHEPVGGPSFEEYVLILTAESDAVLVGKAAGVYKLPRYGFKKEESFSLDRQKMLEERKKMAEES